MEHTEHYQLSQWAAEDRILRTDFNADHAKLDAALDGKLGPVEVLGQAVQAETASGMELDLTGVDWDAWTLVIAELDLLSGSANMLTSLSVTLDVSGTVSRLDAAREPIAGPQNLIFFPLRDGTRPVWYWSFPGGAVGKSESAYQELGKLSVGTNYHLGLREGSRITLYGVR